MFSLRLGSYSVYFASVVVLLLLLLWENGRIAQHDMKLWAGKVHEAKKKQKLQGAREHAREDSRCAREHVWGGKTTCTRTYKKAYEKFYLFIYLWTIRHDIYLSQWQTVHHLLKCLYQLIYFWYSKCIFFSGLKHRVSLHHLCFSSSFAIHCF